jgi:predicted DCC family thiol-disulfide oxidoreductase YuxK
MRCGGRLPVNSTPRVIRPRWRIGPANSTRNPWPGRHSICSPLVPMPALPDAHGPVLLFDGVCNLCNASVQFVIDRDPEARFRFAALQSDVGRSLASGCGIDADALDSLVLVEEGRCYTRSSAALRVARETLGGVAAAGGVRGGPAPSSRCGLRLRRVAAVPLVREGGGVPDPHAATSGALPRRVAASGRLRQSLPGALPSGPRDTPAARWLRTNTSSPSSPSSSASRWRICWRASPGS